MIKVLLDKLVSYEAGVPQSYGALTIYPMLGKADCPHDYISLRKALEAGEIHISELSQSGSVPELKVINQGKHTVLILAGEELRGAKQNRILNTTVLIAPLSETILPVTCTEAGRWSYQGKEFSESGNMMQPSLKSKLVHSVSASYQMDRSARSDQHEVWADIAKLQMDHASPSITGAMADVYETSKDKLEDFQKSFPLTAGQCGIYALIGKRFAGLDLVSSPEVWQDLYDKILRSYAMDALRSQEQYPPQNDSRPSLEDLLKDARLSEFDGIGLGKELRIEKPNLTGSSLLWNDHPAHLSVFPHQGSESPMNNERFHRGMRG
ncbi:MAG: hypothetical protein PHY48_13940 [Candidatus Cloacimonetes bacterium]|nr:hypothetical protein [Candidatus Cloacimonadota bacterium]